MKNGFTLIEIIISITFILLISLAVILPKYLKKNEDSIEKISKIIMEAANVYIKIEKDEAGNIISNQIFNGAKGARITLTSLVNEGYVEENFVNQLYALKGKPPDNNDYYVLFVEDKENYCDSSYIILASWIDIDEKIYLCNEDYDGEVKRKADLINEIISIYKPTEKSSLVSGMNGEYGEKDDWYYSGFHSNSSNSYLFYIPKENGLFYRYVNGVKTYYFRGVEVDNHIKIGALELRILSFNENEIRVITEKPLSLPTTIDWNSIEVNSDFNNSDLQKVIEENWVSYFDHHYFVNYCIKDPDILCPGLEYYSMFSIFQKTDFYYTYHHSDNNGAGFNSNGDFIEKLNSEFNGCFGLPNESELLYAGANNFALSGNDTTVSWVSLGGSTMVLSSSASAYSNPRILENGWKKENYVGNHIKFKYYSNYSECSDSIRPVLSIDPEKIEFEGSGSISNPYRIYLKEDIIKEGKGNDGECVSMIKY